jgi:L-alanine-DL-glutamate epimerase-like enolase superfamily enzyme
MKITDVTCTHVAIPKVSTNIIGGSDEYDGIPYRRESMEELDRMVSEVPHWGNSLSCIVKVFTDEGIVGIGEGGQGKRCEMERIKQNIIGMDVYDIAYISNRRIHGRGSSLRNLGKNPNLPRTKEMSAVEFALWDCIGKKAGQPVYKLLGGKVREKVPITLFLGERPIDDCIRDIDKAIKQGIRTVKLKVGCNDKRDIELFHEVRKQFGYDLIIRIDPNSAWTLPEAIRMVKRMEKYNPQYIEGALRKNEGAYGFRRLRQVTGVPVCICEQFEGNFEKSMEDALIRVVELAQLRACDVLSVDPTRTGGLLGFRNICALCEGYGIQVVTHRALTSISQSTWLTGCITNNAAEYAQDIVPIGQPSGPLYDSVFETLKIEDGYMKPWDAPGWGLTINEEILKKYETVDRNLC